MPLTAGADCDFVVPHRRGAGHNRLIVEIIEGPADFGPAANRRFHRDLFADGEDVAGLDLRGKRDLQIHRSARHRSQQTVEHQPPRGQQAGQ